MLQRHHGRLLQLQLFITVGNAHSELRSAKQNTKKYFFGLQ